eukprot:CAMPEP_0117034426 /NCGR_PEP_ID=MMETSP0472-20121206/24511_1 /TAXON_ID=693140 ORGANISM="Tiarina fusus, Strain LIS" /NCGR_SAMPLE_ID=MMETSP0472 /ASSEMBLY_ACC=CAM_ASM_000603 /LENGTH=249 /DNA_ID=CAMNT_0004743593 /DNA_START=38 /DNA_END=787 /DNA_ORIENTATION=+
MASQKYSQISTEDMEASLSGSSQTLHSTRFTHIEEARALTWMDSFYEGKHGIVAVFDRDGESAGNFLMIRFVTFSGIFLFLSFLYWMLSLTQDAHDEGLVIFDDFEAVYLLIVAVLFLFLGWRSKQAMQLQHIALSTEGIRVDNGPMASVTIPFEHIHFCETKRQTFCCRMISAGFQTVFVHRTAMPLEKLCFRKTKKMEIYGLLRADEFVALVTAMKSVEQNGTYEAANAGMELSTIGAPTRGTSTNE